MPNYDFYCKECALTLVDVVVTYDEAKELTCPACENVLRIKPSRFGFKVQGSAVVERQKLEARFKRREKRIQKEFTPAQAERFENWCKKRGVRRYY